MGSRPPTQNPLEGGTSPMPPNQNQTNVRPEALIANENNLQPQVPPPPPYFLHSPQPQSQHQAITPMLSRTPEPTLMQPYFLPPPPPLPPRSPNPSSFAQPAFQQPFQQPVQQPFQQPFQQPIQQSFQQPVQQSFQQPFQQPVQQPFLQSFQQPFQQPFQQQYLQQPYQQSPQQHPQQHFQQYFQPPFIQYSQLPLQQPSQQQPSQQPSQQSSQQPSQQEHSSQEPSLQSFLQQQQQQQQPSQQQHSSQEPSLQSFQQPLQQQQPSQQLSPDQFAYLHSHQVPQADSNSSQSTGNVLLGSPYALQNQAFFQQPFYNPYITSTYYQHPSLSSPLPNQQLLYQPAPGQPAQSQQQSQSTLTSLSSGGSNNQPASTSTPQRTPSLISGLSNAIQSKAQGYLSKIKEAQSANSASSPAQFPPKPQTQVNNAEQTFNPAASHHSMQAQISDPQSGQSTQNFAQQYSNFAPAQYNNQQTWAGISQETRPPTQMLSSPSAISHTPISPLQPLGSGNISGIGGSNAMKDSGAPLLASHQTYAPQLSSSSGPGPQATAHPPVTIAIVATSVNQDSTEEVTQFVPRRQSTPYLMSSPQLPSSSEAGSQAAPKPSVTTVVLVTDVNQNSTQQEAAQSIPARQSTPYSLSSVPDPISTTAPTIERQSAPYSFSTVPDPISTTSPTQPATERQSAPYSFSSVPNSTSANLPTQPTANQSAPSPFPSVPNPTFTVPPTQSTTANQSGPPPLYSVPKPTSTTFPPPYSTTSQPSETNSPGMKQGIFSNLFSQFENMNFSDASNSTELSKYVYEENTPPFFTTPVRASGNTEGIPRLCLSGWDRTWDVTWYHFHGAPSFLICGWCKANYIDNSPFASYKFETIKKSGSQCNFRTDRMTKVLWPAVCQKGQLSLVVDYVVRRGGITNCKGTAGALMKDKVKWFTDLDSEIPGFISCEACYEDILLGSGFASHFKAVARPQGPSDKWTCDMSLRYVRRAVRMLPVNKDANSAWAEFVRTTKERMALPACSSAFVPAKSKKWYQPRDSAWKFDFCETCLMDSIAFTRYEREFGAPIPENKYQVHQQYMCDLSMTSVSHLLFFSLYRRQHFSSFAQTMKFIGESPQCFAPEGIVGGKWYNLKQEVGNFGICEACYAGLVVPHGLQHFWTPKPQVFSSGALLCTFNTGTHRFSEFATRYDQMLDLGIWSIYADYVQKWSAILRCEKRTKLSDRAWFGWPDCAICQECYERFAVDTSLATSMPYQNEYLEQPTLCCMYSDRMREKYKAACAAGSADELLAFSRTRSAVYQETVPKFMEMAAEIKGEREVASALIDQSRAFRHIDALNSVHGNYGYWGTPRDSGQSAWDRAMVIQDRANNPVRIAELSRLETMWEEVE